MIFSIEGGSGPQRSGCIGGSYLYNGPSSMSGMVVCVEPRLNLMPVENCVTYKIKVYIDITADRLWKSHAAKNVAELINIDNILFLDLCHIIAKARVSQVQSSSSQTLVL